MTNIALLLPCCNSYFCLTRRPNDGYALLAAHFLLDAWNNDPKLLDQCLVYLETALLSSPANYHLKLLTTRVYTLAGKQVEQIDARVIITDVGFDAFDLIDSI